MNTSNRGGGPIRKDIVVITNEPSNSTHTLIVSGQVDRPYTLSPKRLRLIGMVGTPIKQSLILETGEKYPLKLAAVQAQQGKNIRFSFAEVKNQKPPIYQITVENTKQEVGSYLDNLYLVTDSKLRPRIEVPVYGLIQPKPGTPKD